jgi:hypothetical protein
MIFNELAQWAVLLLLAFFVFGLTRQLGSFLVPESDMAALKIGPDVGKSMPDGLLTQSQAQEVLDLMSQRGTDWAGFLVVAEDCPGCGGVLEALRDRGSPDHAPVVALSRASGPEHEALMRSAADLTIVDGERLHAAGLGPSPFFMIVDQSLKVIRKEITADVHDAVQRWKHESGRNGRPEEHDGSAQALQTVTVEGAKR